MKIQMLVEWYIMLTISNFFERARTDFLRQKNIIQSQLLEKSGIAFVVKKCSIEYRHPAKLDDLIQITTKYRTNQKSFNNNEANNDTKTKQYSFKLLRYNNSIG